MNLKNKIIMFLAVALIITTIISPNDEISSLSAMGAVVLVLIMRVSDYIIRRKLIKKIKLYNIDHIKAKENNKWEILLMVIIMFNIFTITKSRYDLLVTESGGNKISLINFMNSLNVSDKIGIVACGAIVILAIFAMSQILLSKTIVSRDKVILYDGLIFDIKDIEEIQYLESRSKKYKRIKIGKGYIDRKIITRIEDFDKVKTLLENKNT